MNINFHYYTIKTLAVTAGFTQEEAQLIASYSQFVDDYNLPSIPICLPNVPDYAKHLTINHDKKGWYFIPITTGFVTTKDEIMIAIKSKMRAYVVAPFHFIPLKTLNTYPFSEDDTTSPQRKQIRTVPVSLNTPSLLQSLLIAAREQYVKEASRKHMIQIAMLLHTFADSYAHQMFSGFWGWENTSRLLYVKNKKTNKDITSLYDVNLYASLPSLGHVNVYTAPDDSYVEFEMSYHSSSSDFNLTYQRNNVTEFIRASKEILDYLLSCQNRMPLSEESWNSLCLKLTEGFYGQTTYLELCEKELPKHWNSLFPSIPYSYCKDKLLEKNDDFFQYNVLAKQMRDIVNGYETPLVI